jgi:ABC-type uncharacterized transport system ATPase subunit
MKQYFFKDSIMSNTKDQILGYMKENELSELTVYEAKRIKDKQFFYCKLHGMAERNNMTCGKKWCSEYKPKNGKSGCCKHVGNLYETGKAVTFNNKP